MNAFERVTEFHRAFNHPIDDEGGLDNERLTRLRVKLIFEEFMELVEACGYDKEGFIFWVNSYYQRQEEPTDLIFETRTNPRPHNKVEVADALGDLEYVINGFAIVLGINLPAVGEEIHRSNMSKLDENGDPIYREDGKVLKGPLYSPPDIQKVLDATS